MDYKYKKVKQPNNTFVCDARRKCLAPTTNRYVQGEMVKIIWLLIFLLNLLSHVEANEFEQKCAKESFGVFGALAVLDGFTSIGISHLSINKQDREKNDVYMTYGYGLAGAGLGTFTGHKSVDEEGWCLQRPAYAVIYGTTGLIIGNIIGVFLAKKYKENNLIGSFSIWNNNGYVSFNYHF